MRLEEIDSLIKNSPTSSVLISESLPPEFPGFVSEVCIRSSNHVSVSYEPYETRAGGAAFWGRFPTLQEAVRSVESFLGIPISEWKIPITPAPNPKILQYRDSPDSDSLIADAIEQKRIPLPPGDFKLTSPGWLFHKEFVANHLSKFDTAMTGPDPYYTLQCYARMLSASGRKRDDIMGIFDAAHSYYMRTSAPEDTVADVMDGIANSYGRKNQNSLNLPLEPSPADIYHLRVIQKSGNAVSAQLLAWAKSPESPESVKLSLAFPGSKIEASAADFFSALSMLRQKLEEGDMLLECYGAGLDVYPLAPNANQVRDAMAYKLTLGKKSEEKDLVPLFGTGPDVLPSKMADQSRYHEKWLASISPPLS